MRVLYDVSTLGLGHLYRQSRGGSHRADRHLVPGLAASPECDLLLCANHSSVAFEGALAYAAEQEALGRVPLVGPSRSRPVDAMRTLVRVAHRLTRAIVRSNVIPGIVRQGGVAVDRRVHPPVSDASPPVDVFHSPGLPLPPRVGGRRSPQRLLTVYDVSYLRYPDLYGPAYQRMGAETLGSWSADDWLIVPSQATRDEVCELGVAPSDRIFLVPLAADAGTFHPCSDPARIAAVRARYGVPEGVYFLCVNSPDPRKNVPGAVRAFARLVEQERVADLALVLAGNSGPGTEDIRHTLQEFPAVRDRVIFTGFVEDDDLAPLYSGARAFVYPSIYEGFGLPPLEAMQCGAPVIAAHASAMPEVVGDAGMLVDVRDEDALAAAMLDLYSRAELREFLRAKGLARAARFTWTRSVGATMAAYRAAVDAVGSTALASAM